jgi:ketosteroid isomerase-like protein
MSAENLELIRGGYERLESEGYESLMDITHPEFEFTTPPALASEPDTYVGEEGIRRYFESFYDAMEEVHLIPQDFIEAGERVIVPTRLVAKGRTAGVEVEQKIGVVWSFREGKILGLDVFATLDEAQAAVEG